MIWIGGVIRKTRTSSGGRDPDRQHVSTRITNSLHKWIRIVILHSCFCQQIFLDEGDILAG